MIKNILKMIVVIITFLGSSCHDVTVGYLWIENPGYNPDTLVVKQVNNLDTLEGKMNPAVEEAVLQEELTLEILYQSGMSFKDVAFMFGLPAYIDEGKDRLRVQRGQPWVSTAIEGVEGTQPINVSINDIKSEDGDVAKLKTVLTVRGDGTFELPLYHDVPVGRYIISLTFKNEGYSKNVDDCFTVIVK